MTLMSDDGRNQRIVMFQSTSSNLCSKAVYMIRYHWYTT